MHPIAFLCPFHFGSFIIRSLPFLASFFQPFISSLILYGHKFVCVDAVCTVKERERESFTIAITLFFPSVPIGDLKHMNNILLKGCVQVDGLKDE